MTCDMSPPPWSQEQGFFLREHKQLISQLFEGILLQTRLMAQGEDAVRMPVNAIKYTLNRIVCGNGNFFFFFFLNTVVLVCFDPSMLLWEGFPLCNKAWDRKHIVFGLLLK